MKLFLTTLVVALAGVASASHISRDVYPCPHSGTSRLAHLSSCSKFVQCVNGVAVEESCAEGLLFNAELQKCTWPSLASCNVERNPCPTWTDPENLVFLANGNNCNNYFMCFDGHPTSMSCANGLNFNRNSSQCDYAQCRVSTEEQIFRLVNRSWSENLYRRPRIGLVVPTECSPMTATAPVSTTASMESSTDAAAPKESPLILSHRAASNPDWRLAESSRLPQRPRLPVRTPLCRVRPPVQPQAGLHPLPHGLHKTLPGQREPAQIPLGQPEPHQIPPGRREPAHIPGLPLRLPWRRPPHTGLILLPLRSRIIPRPRRTQPPTSLTLRRPRSRRPCPRRPLPPPLPLSPYSMLTTTARPAMLV